MNNLQNFDMLSRTLKEERDTYNARFKETQDRKNEATALAYESLTAPFIEQSGLNLLKKGGRTLGKSLNLTDEQIDNIGDIADNIKSGDIGGAINKVRNLGTKNILNEEQKNFLENQKKNLSDLSDRITNVGRTAVKAPKSALEQLDADLKARGETAAKPPTLPAEPEPAPAPAPTPAPASGDIELQEIDPFGGNVIDRTPPSQPEPAPKVFDDEGNEIPDESERIRSRLEDIDPDATETEIRQNARELAKLTEATRAPVEQSVRQSANDFLLGRNNRGASKWSGLEGRETQDISRQVNSTPLNNPADFADDSMVSRVDAARGVRRGNYVVKPQQELPEPAPAPAPAPTPAPKPAPKPATEPRGVEPEEVDRILAQGDEIPAGLNRPPDDVLDPKNLKERFKLLSKEGRSNYRDNIKTAGQNIDQQTRSDLLEQEEQADFRLKRGAYQAPADKPPPQAEDKPPPQAEEPDKPPPVEEDKPPPIETDIEKATEKGGQEIAEGGGIEDPISDIIALGGALGALFGGLHKAHETPPPNPLLQVNPTLQLGQGQE